MLSESESEVISSLPPHLQEATRKFALVLKRAKKDTFSLRSHNLKQVLYRLVAQIHIICVVQKTSDHKFSLKLSQT